MKTRLIICQLLVYLAVIDSRSWSQSSGLPSLTWQGTTNEILALNVAYPLGATAINGLPVTLRVDTGPAVVADGMITVNKLGTVWVTAEQAGDATHAPARESRSFNVRQVAVTPLGRVQTGTATDV